MLIVRFYRRWISYISMPNTRSKGLSDSKLASQFSFSPRKTNKLQHREQTESKVTNTVGRTVTPAEDKVPLKCKMSLVRKGSVKIKYDNEGQDDFKRSKWVPENWELVLNNIREMRKKKDAPVDTMGCDVSHELNLSPKVIL